MQGSLVWGPETLLRSFVLVAYRRPQKVLHEFGRYVASQRPDYPGKRCHMRRSAGPGCTGRFAPAAVATWLLRWNKGQLSFVMGRYFEMMVGKPVERTPVRLVLEPLALGLSWSDQLPLPSYAVELLPPRLE